MDGHVGRMGGDEFAIVIGDGQSRRNVENLADRIIAAIKEPYLIDQIEIRIGVSIGCAFGPIDGATVDDLILKADLALYQAKDAGRGSARYFSSELQSEQDDRAAARAGPESGDRVQAIPPRLSAAHQRHDQKLIGFEALIRWNHPKRGFVPPNRLHPGGRRDRADDRDRRLGDRGGVPSRGQLAGTITVALNIIAKQIVLPALPNTVSEALARLQASRQSASSSRSPKASSSATTDRRSTS